MKLELLDSAEGIGDTLSLITWLIFGSLVVAAFIHELSWQIFLYALLSLSAIRMIPVILSLINSGLSGKEKLFMGWFGPRGLASIVFAIIVMEVEVTSSINPHLNSGVYHITQCRSSWIYCKTIYQTLIMHSKS